MAKKVETDMFHKVPNYTQEIRDLMAREGISVGDVIAFDKIPNRPPEATSRVVFPIFLRLGFKIAIRCTKRTEFALVKILEVPNEH